MADDNKNEEVAEITKDTKKTTSTHVGDPDFYEEDVDDIGDATWGEVCQACCVHSGAEWGMIFVGFLAICLFLYFFLLGLDLLGNSAKIIGGCTAGNLLGEDTNPVAALMIGILATVLLQSSSTTTSIVVSLVGSSVIPTRQAIYMVMGANIGTSVTNTIVALGQMGDGDQLERAFAGATVHDMFNFMTVAVLLPVEVITGYLYRLTKAMVNDGSVRDGDKWTGPVKRWVGPLGKLIIIANKKVVEAVAKGGTCDDFYPVSCEDPANPTKKTCKRGLIDCNKATDKCPAFFQSDATQSDDEVSGGVCFFLALVMLVVCLIGLVTVLQKLLLGMSTRIIYKATNINGYIGIAIGTAVTMLVQSSSITTSTLTPLVGMGVLHLEQMLPLTLGANIGTTLTSILAAMVSDKVESLQVALAHLFFNISGIIIWYPVPFMRNVPLNAARKLGSATRLWRGFPVVYIIVMFFIVPLSLFGISTLFEQNSAGFDTLGSVLVVLIFFAACYFVYWWNWKDGKKNTSERLGRRQRKVEAVNGLADELDFLRARVAALTEHTGLPVENDDEEEGKKLVEENEEEEELAA